MDGSTFLALLLACAPQVDPTTARALVAVESGFEPNAIGGRATSAKAAIWVQRGRGVRHFMRTPWVVEGRSQASRPGWHARRGGRSRARNRW